MYSIRHFVASLRRRSMKLRIDGHNVAFASPDEFMHFLSERLMVPSETMDHIARFDQRALQREARKMLHAYQNVIDIMANSKQTGESLKSLWRRLDISRVPDDHDWPSILFTLGNLEHVNEDYRREALSNYMRFLDNRRQAVDSFRDIKKGKHAGESSMTSMPRQRANDGAAEDKASELELYSRLPHCHTVEVDMEGKPDITVMLGANHYRLSKQGEILTFKDRKAIRTYMLKPGRNMIGRSSHCDVHLDSSESDISRQHLIVEINPAQRISLMDVSSRGTYVRPELISKSHTDTETNSGISKQE